MTKLLAAMSAASVPAALVARPLSPAEAELARSAAAPATSLQRLPFANDFTDDEAVIRVAEKPDVLANKQIAVTFETPAGGYTHFFSTAGAADLSNLLRDAVESIQASVTST